jgi:hypothetical protein
MVSVLRSEEGRDEGRVLVEKSHEDELFDEGQVIARLAPHPNPLPGGERKKS